MKKEMKNLFIKIEEKKIEKIIFILEEEKEFNIFLKELMSSNINIDKLKKYIANGVNINVVDEKGRNYLFFFASKKNFNAIRVLISLGIDMYKEDKLGKTVLSEIGRASCRERV